MRKFWIKQIARAEVLYLELPEPATKFLIESHSFWLSNKTDEELREIYKDIYGNDSE